MFETSEIFFFQLICYANLISRLISFPPRADIVLFAYFAQLSVLAKLSSRELCLGGFTGMTTYEWNTVLSSCIAVCS